MKPTDTIQHLFGHHIWANLRLLGKCATLSEAQLSAKMPGVYGNIRESLEHVVTSEASYLSLISTGQRRRRAEGAPPLTLVEMVELARETGEGLLARASHIQATDTVQIDWGGPLREVPKMVILTQAINHATEHRAEIITVLLQLGIEPPALDSWTYFDEWDRRVS